MTQVPPQFVCPAGHWHEPVTQRVPPVHARPQAPQLALVLDRSTHDPEQLVSPMAQLAAHAPAEHACPAAQTRPHAPQLARSLCTSTQVPPQLVRPGSHTHVPRLHTVPPLHAVPHAPQWARSLWRSTHEPPHRVCAVAQVEPQTPALHA